jgi:hypothetical protein
MHIVRTLWKGQQAPVRPPVKSHYTKHIPTQKGACGLGKAIDLYDRMALTFQPQGASFKPAASFKPMAKACGLRFLNAFNAD